MTKERIDKAVQKYTVELMPTEQCLQEKLNDFSCGDNRINSTGMMAAVLVMSMEYAAELVRAVLTDILTNDD